MITVTQEQQQLLRDLKKYEPETYFHCLRVKKLTSKLINKAQSQDYVNYKTSMIDTICKGAMLHDIGKMNTNNKILTSTGGLTKEEKNVIKNHTTLGLKMLENYLSDDESDIIKDICLKHHERIDGKGYLGIADIPDYIKIISICDVYDALTSDRVYRDGYDRDRALKMIESGECGAFDEWLVACLKDIVDCEE